MSVYKSSIKYDFQCRDCWDVFLGYEFTYELSETEVMLDDAIAYASVTCPSCGGGEIEIEVPVPQSWSQSNKEEPKCQ